MDATKIRAAQQAIHIYMQLVSQLKKHSLKNEIEGALFQMLYLEQILSSINSIVNSVPSNWATINPIIWQSTRKMTFRNESISEEVIIMMLHRKLPTYNLYTENQYSFKLLGNRKYDVGIKELTKLLEHFKFFFLHWYWYNACLFYLCLRLFGTLIKPPQCMRECDNTLDLPHVLNLCFSKPRYFDITEYGKCVYTDLQHKGAHNCICTCLVGIYMYNINMCRMYEVCTILYAHVHTITPRHYMTRQPLYR